MQENLVNLEELGLSEEELFTPIGDRSFDSEKITAPRYSYWHSVFRVFFRKKINIVVLSLLGIVILFAYVYPLFVGFDVKELADGSPNPNYEMYHINDSDYKHLTPAAAIAKDGFNLHNILGRGGHGESTFDAIWFGSRISISLAFICALINMTIGVIIGSIWGFSKKFDMFMMAVYNIIGNVPYILMISVIVMLFTPAFWSMVFALTITGWLGIAYFIRTQVIIIRDREYNLASRCLGTRTLRIALKNILPFMTSVIVTVAATEIPSYISYEVFLSYIGMGMSENSLGKLIEGYQSSMQTPGWGFEFWSPVAIASIITVVLYVVGQNLGDASDPKTHM